jgi:hypothetical protein
MLIQHLSRTLLVVCIFIMMMGTGKYRTVKHALVPGTFVVFSILVCVGYFLQYTTGTGTSTGIRYYSSSNKSTCPYPSYRLPYRSGTSVLVQVPVRSNTLVHILKKLPGRAVLVLYCRKQ